jgi:hypothetical protein
VHAIGRNRATESTEDTAEIYGIRYFTWHTTRIVGSQFCEFFTSFFCVLGAVGGQSRLGGYSENAAGESLSQEKL